MNSKKDCKSHKIDELLKIDKVNEIIDTFDKLENSFKLHIGTFGVKSVGSVISSIVTSISLSCENPVLKFEKFN